MATELKTPASPISRDELTGNKEEPKTLTISRRVVYFQAALLGVIATTFFVFGMMVGTLTSRNNREAEIVDCSISGKIVWESEGRSVGDRGAVVMLLPMNNAPERRLNPRTIHPDSFQPLENQVIETIAELGGAIVRTDARGEFNVEVNSPAKYSLIVVSNGQSDNAPLTKKQMAALSSFFMPVEDVRTDKSIFAKSLRIESTQKNLGEIKL